MKRRPSTGRTLGTVAVGAVAPLGGLVSVLLAASGGGCSLGLDKALLDAAARDGSFPHGDGEVGINDTGRPSDSPSSDSPSSETSPPGDSANLPEVSPPDVGQGETGPIEAAGGGCTQDVQCASSNGCLTGRCVTATGQCVFDLCPPSMCNGATCDPTTHTCGAPTPYTYPAASIPLAMGVSCASIASCVAASFPFVYVGTTQGVYAVTVNNPGDTAPPMNPVGGIPFFPTAIVQSGTRVYFVGALQQAPTTASYVLPVAWIDPPADPTQPLTASSAFVAYPTPVLSNAYAGGTLGLFVEGDADGGAADGMLTAPLASPTVVTLFPSPLDPNEVIVGGSQSSVVSFRVDPTSNDANFAVVTGAGTAGAQNTGETDVSAMGFGTISAYYAFASGPDGSFLFNAAHYQAAQDNYSDVRFNWVLADGSSPTFSGTFTVVEPYTPPAGPTTGDTPIQAPLAGPVAWLDPNRAMVLAAAGGMTNQTSVQVVTRASTPPAVLPLRTVLTSPTNMVGAAGSQSTTSSDSFGYVLSADSPTSATLFVFAPDCPM